MEQGNFRNYLQGKIVNYENQQVELREKLFAIGEIRLAEQVDFDVSRFQHLVLPFLDDECCTSKEGFEKVLERHLDELPGRYSKVNEISAFYSMGLISDCRFLVRCLYDLHVFVFKDYVHFSGRLDELADWAVESTGKKIL